MLRTAILLVLGAAALRAEETADFSVIAKAGLELTRKHGADRVLIVVDVDNTLLTMNQDLGGDAWFEWQAGLLRDEPESPLLVARDFAGLLRVQGILFALSGMHPPEKETPALVKTLQDTGAELFALTSRGPEYESATRRVLKENGFDLARTARPGRAAAFRPFQRGLTEEEEERWKLRDPRPVVHRDGLFLSAGQHKGALLREYWATRDRRHRALLFADDHQKHVDRVREAFRGQEIELKLFRYTRMDAAVERFRKGDKKDVAARWTKLRAAIDEVFAPPPGRNEGAGKREAREPERAGAGG